MDVPDEFQVIVTSLFSSESLVSENLDAVQDNTETSYNEVATISNGSNAAETGSSVAEQQSKGADSSETSADVTAKETPKSDGTEKNKADVANSVAQNNHSNKERGKSTSQSLFYKGGGFHMVNWSVSLFFLFLFVYLYVSPIYLLFTPILICNLEFWFALFFPPSRNLLLFFFFFQ